LGYFILQLGVFRDAGVAIIAGLSDSRKSPHSELLACGSRSIIAVALFFNAAATPKFMLSVVLPTPPFSEIIAIVFMSTPLHLYLSTTSVGVTPGSEDFIAIEGHRYRTRLF